MTKRYVTDPPSAAEGALRASKAGARKRRNSKASRRKRAQVKVGASYIPGGRPNGRGRENRRAQRFDVDQGRGWIVLRAQSGRYTQCAEVMKTAGCPVFEARQEVRVSVEGRSKVTRPPMMRRLLFIGVDAPEQACMLIELDYVEAILCRGEGLWLWADAMAIHGARPAVIPPAMMQTFADNVTGHKKGDKDVGDFVEALFNVGDKVRIMDGPFLSFDAIVQTYDQQKARVGAAVSIFGRETRIELEEKQVEAA